MKGEAEIVWDIKAAREALLDGFVAVAVRFLAVVERVRAGYPADSVVWVRFDEAAGLLR
jgi:hypothetical protein